MANTLIVSKNYWRDGDLIAYSSQHPAFQAVCSQDDDTTLRWRSRHGTGTGNGLFVVTASNKYIDFDEGGGELTATLTVGSYNGTTLADEIETQLNAAGSGVWTVAYAEGTGLFTIAWDGGNFSLDWNTGTNTANTAADLIGFDDSADDSGAATYTSDEARYHSSEYLDLDNGSALEYDFISIRGHNFSSAAVVTIYGADDSAFTTNLVSDVMAYNEASLTAVLGTARTKRYVRIKVVDPDNAAGYVAAGAIVLGLGLDLGVAPSSGYGRGYANESQGDSTPSKNMFLTSPAPSLERWTLTWAHLSVTARGYIAGAVQEAMGSVYAVAWCFDSSDPNNNTLWGRMLEPGIPVQTRAGTTTALWIWSVEIEEHV